MQLILSNAKARNRQVHSAPHEAGMVTVLFVAIIVPLILMMFTVTIELSNFFGIRDELQRVVDREAHEALASGRSSAQVDQAIRARMNSLGGMASVTDVSVQRSANRVSLSASASYQGAFFQFIQRFIGAEESIMPMRLDARVRILPAAALIIFDRGVPDLASNCSDPTLRTIGSFVDRLADNWSLLGGADVAVAVTPGSGRPAQRMSPGGVDIMRRCRPLRAGTLVDASAIMGVVGGSTYSAYSFATQALEIAADTVISKSVFFRTIVFVTHRARYDRAYSSMLYTELRNAVQASGVAIDLYTIVVEEANPFETQPVDAGINGGIFKELSASSNELLADGLVAALTQTVTDRIVLER